MAQTQNCHNHPEFKKALQNVEVATSSTDRDVYQDIPDFDAMYKKREQQAQLASKAREEYKASNNYSDSDLLKRDVDDVSRNIMNTINVQLSKLNNEEMNENNLSEQEKTIRDKMDTQDSDISESNFVADSDKKFDKDINKGQQTGMDIQAM